MIHTCSNGSIDVVWCVSNKDGVGHLQVLHCKFDTIGARFAGCFTVADQKLKTVHDIVLSKRSRSGNVSM